MTRDTQTPPGTGKTPSNRSFGITFAVVFAIIGMMPLLSTGNVRTWALLVAAGCFLVTRFTPNILTRPNQAWAHFGNLLHKITSPIALGLVFVLAFIPIGLIRRMLRKDSLQLRPKSTHTYWIPRKPEDFDGHSMRNQF